MSRRNVVTPLLGLGLGLGLGLMSACTLAPHYQRPDLPVAERYAEDTTTGGVAAADLGWRDFFSDPVMQDLIAMALDNNRNLRVAALNVDAAEAQYRAQHASLFPTIDATASGDFERAAPGQSGSPVPLKIHSYSVGLSTVSYELDLFGRLRSLSKQAQEAYLSTAETRLSTQISLVASVASYYLAWLADQDAIHVSGQTAEAQQRSYDLRRLTLQHGTGTILDVAQAESTLLTAQASLEQYTRQASLDLDELVLLLGAPLPSALQARMTAQAGLDAQAQFPELPAGLPADLLGRRPDIRAAEHTLLAANADIGAARAAFFPAVTLTGNGGTASGTLNKLFTPGSASWAFQPQISLPIFDGGLNSANLDYAKLQKRIEIANYETAIQSAFHDVSDALAGRATYTKQIDYEQRLVQADSRYYDISKMRFDAGVDTFLNVLVAQSSLFSAQLDLISLRLAEKQNLVTLYKALGGGWTATGRTTDR
jgi:multidrug efflux system outer membrane protein